MTPVTIFKVNNLNGTKLGDKRRHLNEIIKTSSQSEDTKTVLLNSFTSSDEYLEKIFRIDVLNQLKRPSELIEILKSEDVTLINRTLRQDWLFEDEIMKNIDVLEGLFRNVSFSTRAKLLKKISFCLEDEKFIENLYDTISNKYGNRFSVYLLPACSHSFIKSVFIENVPDLTNNQLLRIVKKDINFINLYFDQIRKQKKLFSVSKYKTVLMYVALNYTDLFIALFEEYKFYFKLSHSGTKKIIKKHKSRVLENPSKYINILNRKELVKSLRNDFTTFLSAFLPDSMLNFTYDGRYYVVHDLLNCVKEKNRGKLLLSAFKIKYNDDLLNYPKLINENLLKLLSKEDRQKIAEIKEASSDTVGRWLSFMSTDKSIPQLIELIKTTSKANDRTRLIDYALASCQINNDKKALADFCKYFVHRHRNETLSVRISFCQTLQNEFDLNMLDDEHWMYINELLDIFEAKNENINRCWGIREIYLKKIRYLFLKNMPVKELFINFFKTSDGHSLLNSFTELPELEKQCLFYYSEMVVDPNFISLFKKVDYGQKFIYAINSWNSRHPDDHIMPSSFPWLKEYIEKLLKKDDLWYYASIIILYYSNNKEDVVNLKFELLKGKHYMDAALVKWCLHYKPQLLVKHLTVLIEYIIEKLSGYYEVDKKKHVELLKMFKYFNYLDIPQTILKICFAKLNSDSSTTNERCTCIKIIAFVADSDKFLSFILPYYPTDTKLNVSDKKTSDLFDIQKTVIRTLCHVNAPSQTLTVLPNFCAGDYLKVSLRSLYIICYGSAEIKLIPFLKQMIDKPASVRKHAIWLTCKILPNSDIYTLLSSSLLKEKNVSIRETLFDGTMRYFLSEKTPAAWKLLESSMHFLNTSDKISLDRLIKLEVIPTEYIAEFVPLMWSILKKLSLLDKKLWIYNCTLIKTLKWSKTLFILLPDDFTDLIVQDYFLNSEQDEYVISAITDFVCLYLAHAKNDDIRQKRFNTVFNKFKDFIASKWSNDRSYMFEILNSLCNMLLKENQVSLHFAEKLKEFWGGIKKPEDSIYYYLYLEFLLKLKSNNLIIDKVFVDGVSEFINSIVTTYGRTSIPEICSVLSNLLRYVELPVDQDLHFCESVIESAPSLNMNYLMANLISGKTPNELSDKIMYKKVILHLKSTNDVVLQIYVNECLNRSAGIWIEK